MPKNKGGLGIIEQRQLQLLIWLQEKWNKHEELFEEILRLNALIQSIRSTKLGKIYDDLEIECLEYQIHELKELKNAQNL